MQRVTRLLSLIIIIMAHLQRCCSLRTVATATTRNRRSLCFVSSSATRRTTTINANHRGFGRPRRLSPLFLPVSKNYFFRQHGSCFSTCAASVVADLDDTLPTPPPPMDVILERAPSSLQQPVEEHRQMEEPKPVDKNEDNKNDLFKITAPFSPMGDQPQAIEQLVQQLKDGDAYSILRGATGTGKTLGK